MTTGLYYLAMPYHGTEAQKAARVALSLQAAITFLKQGIHVFAPLIYVNQIADQMSFPDLERLKHTADRYFGNDLPSSSLRRQGSINENLESR